MNYVAAYQWSDSDSKWHIVEDSSFNTDGRFGPFDLIKPDGGLGDNAWMQPQSGGKKETKFIISITVKLIFYRKIFLRFLLALISLKFESKFVCNCSFVFQEFNRI